MVRCTDRDPWVLESPDRLLSEIDAACPFAPGRVIVAAVEIKTQVLTDARVASDALLPMGHPEGSSLLCDLAGQMVPDRWSVTDDNGGMSHVLVTVVCRQGRVIPGRYESACMSAWRYANHMRGAFDGDVYVVTPHGWTGLSDHRAGFAPSLPAVAAKEASS